MVKGMGIVLMVLRHARAPYSDFVLLFHMAIFFIASGYLYNGSKIKDFRSLWQYILKKIRGLWLPYFVFNTVYILCNNLFIKINVYTDNPQFLDTAGAEATYRALAEHYSVGEMLKQILKTVFFHGNTQIGGAFWFFYTLFAVLVLYAATDLLLLRVQAAKTRIILKGVIALASLLAGYYCMLNDISLQGLNRVLSVYSLVYMGEMLAHWKKGKECEDRLVWKFTFVILSAIILVITYFNGSIDLSANSIENPVYFLIVSLCGWLLLYNLALLLQRIRFAGNNVICYISIHSVPIIAMHFLAFKLVNAVAVALIGQEACMIAAFPVLMDTGAWWFAYTVVGISVPLLLNHLTWNMVGRIKTSK